MLRLALIERKNQHYKPHNGRFANFGEGKLFIQRQNEGFRLCKLL